MRNVQAHSSVPSKTSPVNDLRRFLSRRIAYAGQPKFLVRQLTAFLVLNLGCMIVMSSEPVSVRAQSTAALRASIEGHVSDINGDRIQNAKVILKSMQGGTTITTNTDENGSFLLTPPSAGSYRLSVSKIGFGEVSREVSVGEGEETDLAITLKPGSIQEAVNVYGDKVSAESLQPDLNGLTRIQEVQGTVLYAGKKNEVLVLNNLNANLSRSNTRQVFAKVPGTNIWEIDSSGLQIGVSSRGLDPNRSWEVNSRQNGYDITADIFGYPEAYFTPPLEGVERIEVVRGASSLQYGAQFGGLVNYVLKEAPMNRRFTFTTEQTGGANALFNSHNRAGGTIGKVTYNGYYQHRQSDGWRDNSRYQSNTGFGSIRYQATDRLKIRFEFTASGYLLQMAGGLTEELFKQDPRGSVRPRNYFNLQWLVPALRMDYQINDDTQLSVSVYGLRGTRYSLFNQEPVAFPNGDLNADNPETPRTIFIDRFRNHGIEARIRTEYQFLTKPSTLAVGFRYSKGKTVRQHGVGFPGSEARFDLFEPDVFRNLHFRSINLAPFVENIFRLTTKLSITPGFRFDHILSTAEGAPIVERRKQSRALPLFGLGISYQISERTNLYANVSQAYRATLFNDQWQPDPNIIVDRDLKDMKGYVSEGGWRGKLSDWLSFDIGLFYLKYNNRLGLLTENVSGAETVSHWTNVADSRNVGVEAFIEADILHLARVDGSKGSLSIFSSIAQISARYQNGKVKGNRVELAPESINRTGLTYKLRGLSATLQYSSVSDQFSDASNTIFTVDAIQGLIPAYQVWDLSASYNTNKKLTLRAGVNNLADSHYFTRRASSYPGPGLIPAEGRTFYASVGLHY